MEIINKNLEQRYSFEIFVFSCPNYFDKTSPVLSSPHLFKGENHLRLNYFMIIVCLQNFQVKELFLKKNHFLLIALGV